MKVKLRHWSKADINSLVLHANHPAIAANMTDGFPHPYTTAAAEKFIEMAESHTPVRLFAIEVDSEAVGGIGIHPQTDIMRMNAELGYWLSVSFWGKGIATLAVKEMVKYSFDNFEFDRIFACPFTKNIASQKVLEKAGFVLEAPIRNAIIKNNIRMDELIYAIRKENK
jgi:RimJ/RimL family protein N-acetyltransferase